MRKKFSLLIFAVILFFVSATQAAKPAPTITADSAILVEASTGRVLYEKNADIVRPPASLTKMMTCIIGLEKLKAIHLNDTKNPFSSHKDRHEKIGQGYIGLEPFKKIVSHSYLKNLPMILETPNDLMGYAEEILILKGLI